MTTDSRKQTSERASRLASEVLNGKQPTRAEIETLAASVLGQDETRGQRSGEQKPK
ncbi:MAG: hypothetical protein ACT4OF_13490 [Caulobacteraceae bacterium]